MQKREEPQEINLKDLVFLIYSDRIVIANDLNKKVHVVKR